MYEKPKLEVILYELKVTKNDLVYQLENIYEYVKNRPVEVSEAYSIVLQFKPIFAISLIYIDKSNGPITESSITPMLSDKSVDFFHIMKQIVFCLSNSF